jgi:hypothetical protein
LKFKKKLNQGSLRVVRREKEITIKIIVCKKNKAGASLKLQVYQKRRKEHSGEKRCRENTI